jgi:hypothetical protein
MLVCEECSSEDIDLVENLPDDRKQVVCLSCRHSWARGTTTVTKPAVNSFAEAKRRFPGPENVDPVRLERVNRLKEDFLRCKPAPQPEVDAYWARYQHIFSRDGLQRCDPQDLKDFANTATGARPGNMSVFNTAWNNMGDDLAARRTRDTIDFLLYGPEQIPLEDRLTALIEGDQGKGMTGFKESLLTKVLCIVQPKRFLPLLTYTSPNVGKKEIAELVYELDLPDPSRVRWTIGRLILWSNDVLLNLVGDGFVHTQHISQFLWEIKDRQSELHDSIAE